MGNMENMESMDNMATQLAIHKGPTLKDTYLEPTLKDTYQGPTLRGTYLELTLRDMHRGPTPRDICLGHTPLLEDQEPTRTLPTQGATLLGHVHTLGSPAMGLVTRILQVVSRMVLEVLQLDHSKPHKDLILPSILVRIRSA